MSKREGWNGNEADRQERQRPIEDDNWNPAEWDLCDEHEMTFPMGDVCPGCTALRRSGER